MCPVQWAVLPSSNVTVHITITFNLHVCKSLLLVYDPYFILKMIWWNAVKHRVTAASSLSHFISKPLAPCAEGEHHGASLTLNDTRARQDDTNNTASVGNWENKKKKLGVMRRSFRLPRGQMLSTEQKCRNAYNVSCIFSRLIGFAGCGDTANRTEHSGQWWGSASTSRGSEQRREVDHIYRRVNAPNPFFHLLGVLIKQNLTYDLNTNLYHLITFSKSQ